MSTTPLTDSINTLIARANRVTGASDTTLSQAFTTLVAGNGGSSSTIADFITVTQGNNYVVRITYKSTVAGNAWLNFGTWNDGNMPKYGFPIEKTDAYTTVDIEFPNATFTAAGNAHVLFQSGKLIGTITIQKVEVFESAPEA